jgi:hypothetical protein
LIRIVNPPTAIKPTGINIKKLVTFIASAYLSVVRPTGHGWTLSPFSSRAQDYLTDA